MTDRDEGARPENGPTTGQHVASNVARGDSSEIGLAIDIGTSMVKVAAYDEIGRLIGTARADAPIRRPRPGYCEYDTADIWASICAAVAQLRDRRPGRVTRISATGQGDGCWLIDADGNTVGRSILWNDGRAGDVVSRWADRGLDAVAYRVTGSAHFAGSQAAILQWLSDHEPERLRRARYALFSTGWLTHKLCGEAVMDRSDASLPWLDLRTGTISEELLQTHDLTWSARLRPRLLEGHPAVGRLTETAAAGLGIAAGTPVVHGPFDCVAMALGAGVVDPGDALAILGTTLIVEGVTESPDPRGEPAGMNLATAVPGRWLQLMGTLSGTDTLNWGSGLLGTANAREYVELAADSPVGARGVHVLPYFSPAGERAPFIDSTARGSILGLTLDHSRGDLARAHLEGLAYALRHCVESLNEIPDELTVCGGASASPLLCQLLADVIARPIHALGGAELGTLGADVAARVALGAGDIRQIARTSVPEATFYRPDPENAACYEQAYTRFHELREQAKPSWTTLLNRRGSSAVALR